MSQRVIKANSDILRRLKNIRDLWFALYNDPDKLNLEKCAVEFFYTVGDLLEGKYIEQLDFHKIDRTKVMKQVKES